MLPCNLALFFKENKHSGLHLIQEGVTNTADYFIFYTFQVDLSVSEFVRPNVVWEMGRAFC